MRYDNSYYTISYFWATVCKTVRPMLSYRCLSILSVWDVRALWPKSWNGSNCNLIFVLKSFNVVHIIQVSGKTLHFPTIRFANTYFLISNAFIEAWMSQFCGCSTVNMQQCSDFRVPSERLASVFLLTYLARPWSWRWIYYFYGVCLQRKQLSSSVKYAHLLSFLLCFVLCYASADSKQPYVLNHACWAEQFNSQWPFHGELYLRSRRRCRIGGYC